MEIRVAAADDWPGIYPFYSAIRTEGRTYAFPASQNRPGRGAHVATASFIVDPAHRVNGVGRALGVSSSPCT